MIELLWTTGGNAVEYDGELGTKPDQVTDHQTEEFMNRTYFLSAAIWIMTAALPSLAQQAPVLIVGLVELSGTGATSGTNFDNGVKLAVKEINAIGGILGRKVEYTSSDTQSAPQTAKALAQKAVDDGAYIVMGPVFSGSILVSMAETRRAGIPNFTGGESAAITQQGNPYIFRTSFTQATAMPKVARYIKDTIKAKTIAIVWVNNDFGKGGRDTVMKALEAQGIKIAADISTDPGQVDFSGAVLRANPMTAIVEAYRSVLLYGAAPDPVSFGCVTALGLVLFPSAWLLFHRSEFRFAENI